MSHAPNEAVKDPTKPQKIAYQAANNRQQELLRNGVSNSGHERNCCFLNTGTGRFANISAAAGLDHIGDGRAYAVVDWDHDGDLDLWATNRTAPRVQFLRNHGTGEHQFLSVKLQGNGTTTNRDAVGARVELILANPHSDVRDLKSIQTVRAGEGFLSQSSKRLHFGLGAASEIERLIVRWPGGDVEEFANLQPNQHYTIVQGSSEATRWSRPEGAVQLASVAEKSPPLSEEVRIPLRYRVPMPALSYESAEGESRMLRIGAGMPVLVNLWASWCQPCLKELVELQKQEQKLRSKGLHVVALSVDQLAEDQASNPQAARAFLDRQEFSFEAGFATEDLIGKLETTFYYLYDFRRPWAVPTSLLIDRKGQLAVVYVGPVEVDQLMADVQQIGSSDTKWFDAALPFPGRWSGEPRHPNLTKLIQTYLNRGYVQDGLRFVDRYADALVGDAEAAPLLRRLATSLEEQGHIEKAKLRLEQAIEANPGSAASLFQLSQLMVERKQFEEAVTNCRKAVYINPKFAEAHFLLANLLHAQGNAEVALKHFRETVKLRPQLAKARLALGTAYAAQLQWEAASTQLQEAVTLEPDNATFRVQLGRVLHKRGQAPAAISQYKRALELKPDAGDVHYYLGSALAAQGATRAAIGNLRRAHELQPDSLLFGNGLAWVIATEDESSVKDRAEAVVIAEAAAKKTEFKHPQVLDTLAAAHAASGDFEQAIAVAEQAIKLADLGGSKRLAEEIRDRLAKYRRKEPFREIHSPVRK